MKSFNVSGTITLDIDFDIEAESESEAALKATERITDYYRLDVQGADHCIEKTAINLDVIEIEYED